MIIIIIFLIVVLVLIGIMAPMVIIQNRKLIKRMEEIRSDYYSQLDETGKKNQGVIMALLLIKRQIKGDKHSLSIAEDIIKDVERSYYDERQ